MYLGNNPGSDPNYINFWNPDTAMFYDPCQNLILQAVPSEPPDIEWLFVPLIPPNPLPLKPEPGLLDKGYIIRSFTSGDIGAALPRMVF